MRFRFLVCLFPFLFQTVKFNANSLKKDSLDKLIENAHEFDSILALSQSLIKSNPDAAQYLANKAFNLTSSNNSSEKLEALNVIIEYFKDKENCDSILFYSQIRLKIALNFKSREVLKSYFDLIDGYFCHNNFQDALKMTIEAKEMSILSNDSSSLAVCHGILGKYIVNWEILRNLKHFLS